MPSAGGSALALFGTPRLRDAPEELLPVCTRRGGVQCSQRRGLGWENKGSILTRGARTRVHTHTEVSRCTENGRTTVAFTNMESGARRASCRRIMHRAW